MPAALTGVEVRNQLGLSRSASPDRLPEMRHAGFPEPVPILRRDLIADVQAQPERRRQVRLREGIEPHEKITRDPPFEPAQHDAGDPLCAPEPGKTKGGRQDCASGPVPIPASG